MPPRTSGSASHGPESTSSMFSQNSNILTPPSDAQETDFSSGTKAGISPPLRPLRRAVTEPPSRIQLACPLVQLLPELVGAPPDFLQRTRRGCPICSGDLAELGPYILSKSMGSGTFSHVRLGQRKESSGTESEDVVVKILCRYHSESLTYFENERRTLSVSLCIS